MAEIFQTIRFHIPIPTKGASVTGEIFEPDSPTAVLAIGHGAGSNLDQPFLKQLSAALARQQIITIRFNFLYSELKKKMPDRFPVAAVVIRAVLHEAHRRYPDLPVFGGGKSFGGRMTSMTLAEVADPTARGIVFFGFPLHPSGSPSVERAAHLQNLSIPLLFLQGTRDALATPELLRPEVARLSNAVLVEYEGADHSFKGGKQASIDNIASQVASWIKDRT
jgi:uncharacterized protein